MLPGFTVPSSLGKARYSYVTASTGSGFAPGFSVGNGAFVSPALLGVPRPFAPFPGSRSCGLCYLDDTGACVRDCTICPPGPQPDGCTDVTVSCRDSLCCPAGQDPCPGIDPQNASRSFCCPVGQACCDAANHLCCNTSAGQQCCGDLTCRNLRSDPQNCGACDNVCTGGTICQNGACVCPSGLIDCSGVCKNLAADSQNCGSCGNVCTGGKFCQNGICVCPSGLTDCGGICKNLATDSQNCGSCGNVCTGGRFCQNGRCICPSGLTDCGGVCKNLTNDAQNCGSCGKICTGQVCVNSTCICPSPLTLCNGVCVNTNTDPQNCGGCDKVCPSGQMCCGATGGCTSLSSDSKNCGRCGNTCPSPQICVNGNCMCPSPQIFCPGVGCVNPLTDPNNCGACNNQCLPDCDGGRVCTAGHCVATPYCSNPIACPAGCDPEQDECTYYCAQRLAQTADQAAACIRRDFANCEVPAPTLGLCPPDCPNV
jgi:hypothetical protein